MDGACLEKRSNGRSGANCTVIVCSPLLRYSDVMKNTCSIIVPLVSAYPYNVNATQTKATSVVLRWKSTEIVVEEFLVEF